MRIKAIYTPDKEAYDIEADEQRMTIPKPFMSQFISVCQIAHHRQKAVAFAEIIRKAKEKERAARKLIEDSNHPAILPFIKKDPEPGRPKGSGYDLPSEERITKKKLAKEKKQKEAEPPPKPFKHEKFV